MNEYLAASPIERATLEGRVQRYDNDSAVMEAEEVL